MTAAECLQAARAAGPGFQRTINEFLDVFRRALPSERERMIQGPIPPLGHLEGLVAAVVSALCREAGLETPA